LISVVWTWSVVLSQTWIGRSASRWSKLDPPISNCLPEGLKASAVAGTSIDLTLDASRPASRAAAWDWIRGSRSIATARRARSHADLDHPLS
jgi:hypothetical protein